MKLNFNIINQKKNKEKENSKLLERILIEYLSDYFENIEFDYNFGRDGFTFLAKEVEFRRDLLQKFGIPLELTIGKIKVIKLSVKSLITLKNFAMEVSDIEIEVQTIHISKDYKKNYLNYRKKFLNEWESKHKKFFNSMAKHSILEAFIIDRLIPIKIDIKNINIKINDSISSKKTIKQLEINIDSIHSLGCNSKWEEIEEVEKDDLVYRTLEINQMCVTANKIDKRNNFYVETFLNDFNLLVKASFLRSYKTCDLKTTPKIKLEMIFTTPLVVNLSVSNINILQNLLTYLTTVKSVEKYWVNRPEFHEEGKINKTDALKWFLYAFRVLREEIRNNKRQNYELSSLIDKIISMEKYIQYYKESHKLIIAPWIHQKDHKIELQNLENKMSLDDIIYCRELSFAELLTEGRAFCASGEVGEGYKPFVHLWEFYVNDLRTKWMNKEENEVTTIKLSDNERRELMTIWKNDRDMVLLSYIKGEPNHPKDIMFDCEIKMKLIILNFSRNVDFQYEKEQQVNYKNLIEYSTTKYNSKIKERFEKELKFIKAIKGLTKEKLAFYLKDEIQNDNNNDSDDEAMQLEFSIQSKSHGEIVRRSSSAKEAQRENPNSILEQKEEDSCVYIDEIVIEDSTEENNVNGGDIYLNDNDYLNKDNIGHIGNTGNSSILKAKKTEINKGITKIPQKEKKVLFNKTLFTVFLFATDLQMSTKRNEQTDLLLDVLSFHIIDHNYTYITMNKKCFQDNASNYKTITIDKIIRSQLLNEDKNKRFPSFLKEGDVPEKIDECLIYYLIDILKNPKTREIILKKDFVEENNFFYLYEDSFGFKKCETQGQGLTSLKNHYNKIVIDYLITKNIFADLKQQIVDTLSVKYKKKIDKLTKEEKNELVKKVAIKAFEDYINPDNKRLYENGIQEKFIQSMVSDLNSMLEITSIALIKQIISSLYSFHVNDTNFSKLLSDQIKLITEIGNQPKKDHFFNVSLHKKGREYPNYIMKKKEDLVLDTEVLNDEPNTNIKVEINKNINMKITNELIAEFQLIFPEIAQHEQYTYVGNILNDLTQSYLTIFDNFRQLRAKFGVFNDVEKKYKNELNQNDPIEIIYLDNLTKHLKELSNGFYDLSFTMNKDKRIQLYVYDKVFFLDNESFSSFGLVLKDINLKCQKLKEIPVQMDDKGPGYRKIPLPENYDMSKVSKMLFSSRLSIDSIEIIVDDCEPILRTDFQVSQTFSLMKNTLFIPDYIIDAHTSKLELNIYPCLVKMLKNLENISFFQNLYSSKVKKNVKQSTGLDNISQIIKNNFDRFIRNLDLFFKDKCSYKNENPDSKLKNLEYYLEKRNNILIMYSIGHSNDPEQGIIVNVYSQDNYNEERPQGNDLYKQANTVRPNNKLQRKMNSNSSSNYFDRNQRTNSFVTNEHLMLNNCRNVEPFFSFKSDLFVFHSVVNLFYTQKEIWLCPIKTVKDCSYETFKIELNQCEPFSFSSNEYMFCKHFIDSLDTDNISFGELSDDFPYDNSLKIQNLNFNCLFKQTTLFYEESPKLRNIYLNHFSNVIHNYEMAKMSRYLSNLSINIHSIDINIIFKNNKDLIDLFYGASNYNSLYNNQGYKTFLQQRKVIEHNITNTMFPRTSFKQKRSLTSKALPVNSSKRVGSIVLHNSLVENNVRMIPVHVNELNIDKFNLVFMYEDRDVLENKKENLELKFKIKNIKYIENSYNINERKENEIKGHLFILSILMDMRIPKNFANIKDFDSEDRVPIIDRDYMKKRFEKIKNDPYTKNERIIFQVQGTSLKLSDISNVTFEISNSIKFGFCHKEDSIDIDEYILWVFPYSNGTEEEKKLVQERIETIPNSNFKKLDPSFKKSLSIEFSKTEPREIDNELDSFNDVSHFSNFQKVLYIIKSTFAYKMIYSAQARINIGALDVPSRAYDYIYYIKNWQKEINKMIEENHPTKKEEVIKEANKEEKKEEIASNVITDDINNESIAPLEGENSVIFSLFGQMLFLRFKQDQTVFSTFLYMKSTIELYKNSNNEKLLYFGCVDFNWKATDSRCDNLFFKKNPNDKKGKMLEIHFVLDNSKVINMKTKTEHKFLVEFHDCIVVYFMKYVGEVLDFLDYNEQILLEYPLKSAVWSMLPQKKDKYETFYYIFTNFSIILPENTKSANFMRFNCTKGYLATNTFIDETKLLNIEKNEKIYVIDKKTFFGLQSETITNKNTLINDINEKNSDNKCYLYLNELDSCFTNVDSIMCVNGQCHDFLIADEVKINLQNPKSAYPQTLLYEYYWKLNNKKTIRLKNTMTVSMKNAKVNLTLGDFFSVDHFIDSNFDEPSSIFPESLGKFNFIELDVKFKETGNVDVNVFKVFKNFFSESKPIERIGTKLPGYDDDIVYDTQM